MKVRTVLTIDAVVATLWGILFLAAPGAFNGLEGLETNNVGLHFIRSCGAGLLSVGVMALLARSSKPSAARTGLVAGFALWTLIDAIKEAIGLPGGESGFMRWPVTAMLAIASALNILVLVRSRSDD